MSLFGLLRVDIKEERVEIAAAEAEQRTGKDERGTGAVGRVA
jgi:hypothetical protein